MIRPTRRNWWIFAFCTAVLVAALAWLTAVMLRLDTENAAARDDFNHQIAVSKALWRMDSWLGPQLATEAARPHFVYRAYFAQRQAYTKVLSEIESGEVLTPSPLLAFRSELFPLHFQIDRGKVSSPQVPEGNLRDLTEGTAGAPRDLGAKAAQLEGLRGRLRSRGFSLDADYRIAIANVTSVGAETRPRGMLDYGSRSRSLDQARQTPAETAKWRKPRVAPGTVTIGPLLPIWIAGEAPALLFVRQVRLADRNLFQGMLADWPRLRSALLGKVGDLFELGDAAAAPLTLVDEAAVTQADDLLATVPARFTAPKRVGVHRVSTRTVLVLSVVWGGLLIALVAVAFALHSTNRFGEHRARFASAVTHELRTPLTTFRMYSEMLADNMVQDPAQRTVYLETLKGEADRLSRLVENVLSYARIEDGRFNAHPERIELGELLERVRPVLEQRAREADRVLEFTVDDGVEIEVDVDAITQILFNLVDNACKYASEASDPRIEVRARGRDHAVAITVRDHGPGIPAKHRAAIFEPFERADRGMAENETPGVGLGLALARALAQDLGGRLELVAEPGPGAAFALTIPKARAATSTNR